MAGIPITVLSGSIETLYGKSLYPINQCIEDNATKDSRYTEQLKAIFVKDTSNNFAESTTGQTGIGDMEVIEELGAGKKDTIMETYQKVIEFYEFFNSVVISAKSLQDAKMGTLSRKTVGMAAQFGNAYPRTQLKNAIAALTGGLGTAAGMLASTYSFGGKTFNRCTADGMPLFSTAHKIKKTGGTYGNVYTNVLGTTTAILDKLVSQARMTPNESGEVMGIEMDTIIIPGNTPVQERMIKALIASEKQIGSSYNDINTQKGLWKLVVLTDWQAAAGTEPYIIMSSQELEATSGSIFYDRVKFEVTQEIDLRKNVTMGGYARWGCGFPDWRHMIAGGVAGGTTLS